MDEPTKEHPIEVVIDALENAAFFGRWKYPAEDTALVAAMETAEIVVAALEEAGFLTPEPEETS